MASIALTTADRVHVIEPGVQATLPTAAAITAGAPVTIDSNGKFAKADADGAGTLSSTWGIALRSVASGESLTAQRTGLIGGWDFSAVAYMANVLLADTAGEITATSSESNGGSADVVLGFVEAVWDHLIGGSPSKALRLTLGG